MSDEDVQSGSSGLDALWQTVISDDADLEGALRRVAETGCRLLTNCTSASVTLIDQGRAITVGSTNDTAQALDDAQYAAGNGPWLTAAREVRFVRVDDIGADERWPMYSASAPGQRHRQFVVGAACLGRCRHVRRVQHLRQVGRRVQR
jgi:GAF domain